MSIDGAKRYGVVILNNHSLDEPATRTLRADMAGTRSEPHSLFNFGGDIETLKARARAETGFDAPQPPRFMTVTAEAAE